MITFLLCSLFLFYLLAFIHVVRYVYVSIFVDAAPFCPGFESPGEWDDHRRVFGLDGQDIQYAVSSFAHTMSSFTTLWLCGSF